MKPRELAGGDIHAYCNTGVEIELIYAGLGQLPEIPVNLQFDELNYSPDDTAIITLSGDASDIVSLLIIDPFNKPKTMQHQ